MAIVYLIENRQNRKKYIGQTVFTLQRRWVSHLRSAKDNPKNKFHKAIKKYGSNCWNLKVIEEISEYFTIEREKYWIRYYDTVKNGYNSTYGGEGRRIKVEIDFFENYEEESLINYQPFEDLSYNFYRQRVLTFDK